MNERLCDFAFGRTAASDLESAHLEVDAGQRSCSTGPRRVLRPARLVLLSMVALVIFVFGCTKSAPGESGIETEVTVSYRLDETWPRSSEVTFDEVSWVEVDSSTGMIYLLQRSQPVVSTFSPDGLLLGFWSTEELGDPHSISLQSLPDGTTTVWITDMAPPQPAGQGYGHCLKRFTTEGTFLGSIGVCGANSEGTGLDPIQFDKVTDVAFDSQGNLFVTDGDLKGLNNRLLKLDPAGGVLFELSAPGNQPGTGPLEFNLPHAVLVDDCDRVWVADALNHRIQVVSNDGGFLGQLACFDPYGVYGMSLSLTIGEESKLFVTTSPTDGGGGGIVSVFDVPMACSQPLNLTCTPLAQWPITLPTTGETAMLHSASSTADASSLYLAELGGILPPQKWIANETLVP